MNRPHPLPRLLLCACLALTACDDDPMSHPPDAVADRGPDEGPDATLDAGPDAAPDAEADLAVDAAPDAITPDAITPDGATPDAAVDAAPDAGPPPHPLRISELMPSNDGTWVDEIGEADDWIELHNIGPTPLSLAGYRVDDGRDRDHALPDITLEPGAVILLWADDPAPDAEDAGPLHLPFGLSADGEEARLFAPDGSLVDAVDFPALDPDVAWVRGPSGAWGPCRYASPAAPNPERCGPAPPIDDEGETFDPYDWPDPWPSPAAPLRITELHLPADGGDGFVEVLNVGDIPVNLAAYTLHLAPMRPAWTWPAADGGLRIPWPADRVEAGARLAVPVPAARIGPLAGDPLFEGVVQLWAPGRMFPAERVDFMSWPAGAALTRFPTDDSRHVFCARHTPGEANDTCDRVPSRPLDPEAGRLRHLRTPGDFAALADGGVQVGISSVKVLQDLETGGVHLLSARRWDLHYTFAREAIEGQPHLDRCDADESRAFTAAWSAWSRINYFQVEGRRFLSSTLAHHAGPDLRTVEFASGDAIDPGQMRQAFFGAAAHTLDPTRYHLRPRTPAHLERARTLEGGLPIVDPGAPYRGLTWQPLTQTVGYGVLRFVPTDALHEAALGPQVIVVTDQVPNDIPLVGGLVTEAFQTPLAHVNLLSRNRDTPNMALRDAREHPTFAPHFGALVRLDVAADGWSVRPAEPEEAQAFWDARRPDGPPLSPRLDPDVRGVQPLAGRALSDLPAIGAKAAQLAELGRVDSPFDGCPGPITIPADAMAIPLVHGIEHAQASGALDRLALRREDPRFDADPRFRRVALEEVRRLIEFHPVEPALLAEVEAYVDARFPGDRVRFRSSSNTEDLPGFNGAGLYTSVGVDADERGPGAHGVEDAIRAVWASLYLERAWDERAWFGIDQSRVAMAVLVHRAFPGERANGVGISRNVLEPIREQYYLNAQHGEALVTNPAPGVQTEQILFDRRRAPRITRLARSSLRDGAPVLSEAEIEDVACALRAIHWHFQPRIDPHNENPWFAMDIEFKHLGPDRTLLIKQARPYSFGAADVPADCRSL